MNITDIALPTLVELDDALQEGPPEEWINRCHVISLRAVRTGLFGEPGPQCRVVRGITAGYHIGGQHSWIALGTPYDPACIYIDITAQAWGRVDGIVVTSAEEAYNNFMAEQQGHCIHGYDPGSIWSYGKPERGNPPHFWLDPTGLSDEARTFLDLLGPLSVEGWKALFTFPQQDWPHREICKAIVKQIPRIDVLVPIDVISMVTDDNHGGLYW